MLWKPIISLFERGVRDLVGYLHPAISTSVPTSSSAHRDRIPGWHTVASGYLVLTKATTHFIQISRYGIL